MSGKWRLNKDELKKLLLVSNVIIGAKLGATNETSESIERERTETINKQHQINKEAEQK